MFSKRYHPYAHSANAGAFASKFRPPIMGHFFEFDVDSNTTSAIYGTYSPSIHEKIYPSYYGMKNPANTKRKIDQLCGGKTDDIYIVGIKYRGKSGKPNDSQPTITGKTKGNESFPEGAVRELAEEIGCFCNLSNVTPLVSFDKRNSKIHTFVVSASQITPLIEVPKKSVGEDNFNSRVEIVIYGTIDEIRKALSNVTLRPKEETDIMGVMAYPLNDAK